MENIKGFFKNKRVLITGHTGFKGAWLSIWLKQLGAHVTGIALDPRSERDLFVLAGLAGKVKDYRENILNRELINSIFQKEQPEIVFHLAAQALVLTSYEHPVATFETNIMGTVNILEACRNTESVKQIVIITTDKVYENSERNYGYSENDPLGGHDPYSASKSGAEIVTQSYLRSFFVPGMMKGAFKTVATARAGNVIGGGDWSLNRIIPDCIRALEEEKTIVIRNPASVRPWQFVLEPIAGYLMLAYKLSIDPQKFCGPWNFGPEENCVVSVGELVDQTINCWGQGKWETSSGNKEIHEAGILRLKIDKSKDLLGWKPVLGLEETIRMTVDWYKKYSPEDVYTICSDQIEYYTAKWNSLNGN